MLCFGRLDCCDEGWFALWVSLCGSGVGYNEASMWLRMHFSN
jgi:hypothetical protein